ncbi:unnamed protein product [Gordionus sp. m RMFG-2023]
MSNQNDKIEIIEKKSEWINTELTGIMTKLPTIKCYLHGYAGKFSGEENYCSRKCSHVQKHCTMIDKYNREKVSRAAAIIRKTEIGLKRNFNMVEKREIDFLRRRREHRARKLRKRWLKNHFEKYPGVNSGISNYNVYVNDTRIGCQSPEIVLRVQGRELRMLFDTGAMITLVSKATWMRLWPNIRIVNMDVEVRQLDRTTVPVKGKLIVKVQCEEGYKILDLWVIEMDTQSILGWDWIRSLGPAAHWWHLFPVKARNKWINNARNEDNNNCCKGQKGNAIQGKRFVDWQVRPRYKVLDEVKRFAGRSGCWPRYEVSEEAEKLTGQPEWPRHKIPEKDKMLVGRPEWPRHRVPEEAEKLVGRPEWPRYKVPEEAKKLVGRTVWPRYKVFEKAEKLVGHEWPRHKIPEKEKMLVGRPLWPRYRVTEEAKNLMGPTVGPGYKVSEVAEKRQPEWWKYKVPEKAERLVGRPWQIYKVPEEAERLMGRPGWLRYKVPEEAKMPVGRPRWPRYKVPEEADKLVGRTVWPRHKIPEKDKLLVSRPAYPRYIVAEEAGKFVSRPGWPMYKASEEAEKLVGRTMWPRYKVPEEAEKFVGPPKWPRSRFKLSEKDEKLVGWTAPGYKVPEIAEKLVGWPERWKYKIPENAKRPVGPTVCPKYKVPEEAEKFLGRPTWSRSELAKKLVDLPVWPPWYQVSGDGKKSLDLPVCQRYINGEKRQEILERLPRKTPIYLDPGIVSITLDRVKWASGRNLRDTRLNERY